MLNIRSEIWRRSLIGLLLLIDKGNFYVNIPLVHILFFSSDAFNDNLVPKNGSCGNGYYQTIRLGIQSKLYEQNYSQMILAI